MKSKTKKEDPRDKETIEVGASYASEGYPDTDDVVRDSDILITAMIPRPEFLKPDVLVAVDGSVCFKVTAKVCRVVWKQNSSGRWVRVTECSLGDATICMDRKDWA